MEEKILKEKNKPTCQKCGSGQVYIRFTTNELVCRLCGNIQKIGEENKE